MIKHSSQNPNKPYVFSRLYQNPNDAKSNSYKCLNTTWQCPPRECNQSRNELPPNR